MKENTFEKEQLFEAYLSRELKQAFRLAYAGHQTAIVFPFQAPNVQPFPKTAWRAFREFVMRKSQALPGGKVLRGELRSDIDGMSRMVRVDITEGRIEFTLLG